MAAARVEHGPLPARRGGQHPQLVVLEDHRPAGVLSQAGEQPRQFLYFRRAVDTAARRRGRRGVH